VKEVGNLPEQSEKLILPFAVTPKDRLIPFTKDMEMAALFYLAETDRKKGEGRVLKKPAEKLTFIAETCYPLWIVPWNGKIMLFDGLHLTDHVFSYDIIPDVKTFNTDSQASSKSREAYCASLNQNANYFQDFTGKEERTVDGLITDQKFMEDFMEYLPEAKDVKKIRTTKAFLSPALDTSEISVCMKELSDLKDDLTDEIASLEKSMKRLSKDTKKQVKALQNEMKENMENYDKKIEKVRPRVMAKIKKIQERRDTEVTRISRGYDRKLGSLHKNRVKLEKTIERLYKECERCEADIKVYREHGDEVAELQLAKKLDETRKRIPVLQKEIKELDKQIANVDDTKKIEVSRARVSPDDRIEEAMKDLRDLEAAKEARSMLDQRALETLEEMTTSIINEIHAMIKTKEEALNEINSLGIPGEREKSALVYIPTYFVCYETKGKKRYVVYPPSIVGSMGIRTKLKGVFSAKMKSFLQPRSQVIAAFLDQLVDLTNENPVFEKDIIEAGTEASILRIEEMRGSVLKGLRELRDGSWISKDEYEYLSKLL
jgi:chaperonin cofactor prefoldin